MSPGINKKWSGRRGSNPLPASHEWKAIRGSPAEPLISRAFGAGGGSGSSLSSENPSPARENRSIKNGAGDGARTRFRHPTNGRPFAGALPNLSSHAPSAPVEAAGPLSRRKILLLHGKPVNKKWSGRRGSNPLPPPWQGGALPDELRPQMVPPVGIEPTTRGFSVRCSTN